MTIANTYSFMDVGWQYNNPPNPADAKDGPQTYDTHLYYSFGVGFRLYVSGDALLIFTIAGRCRSQSGSVFDQHLQ